MPVFCGECGYQQKNDNATHCERCGEEIELLDASSSSSSEDEMMAPPPRPDDSSSSSEEDLPQPAAPEINKRGTVADLEALLDDFDIDDEEEDQVRSMQESQSAADVSLAELEDFFDDEMAPSVSSEEEAPPPVESKPVSKPKPAPAPAAKKAAPSNYSNPFGMSSNVRRPGRTKDMAVPQGARETFLINKPEDHVETEVFFSGTVSFNNPDDADRFLEVLTEIVNRSAVVFHKIRIENPGAAQSLSSKIRELLSMLHHFPEATEEQDAIDECNALISSINGYANKALEVLDRPPTTHGNMWEMKDNVRIAENCKSFLEDCCVLMKISEREQAQQFVVVNDTCRDTVEKIIKSHKRHCGIYFTHMDGYVNGHLHPMLDNRIETSPDSEQAAGYREAKEAILRELPKFKNYMDSLWPPGAPERSHTQAPVEEKLAAAGPLLAAFKQVDDILKMMLKPVSNFDFKFNLPAKPVDVAAQKLVRASVKKDPVEAKKAAKELTQQLAKLDKSDPTVAAARMSARDLLKTSKEVLAEKKPAGEMIVARQELAEAMDALQVQEAEKRKEHLAEIGVSGAMPDAIARLADVAADPTKTRPDRQSQALRKSSARLSCRASVVVQLFKKKSSNGKAREELYEASDRVAKALKELADLEADPDADEDEMMRLLDEVDAQQADLFDMTQDPRSFKNVKEAEPEEVKKIRNSVRQSISRGTTVAQFYKKKCGEKKPNQALIIAAEKVAETLEELAELENDPGCDPDELSVLLEEANKEQRNMVALAKDDANFEDYSEEDFGDDEDLMDFLLDDL